MVKFVLHTEQFNIKKYKVVFLITPLLLTHPSFLCALHIFVHGSIRGGIKNKRKTKIIVAPEKTLSNEKSSLESALIIANISITIPICT